MSVTLPPEGQPKRDWTVHPLIEVGVATVLAAAVGLLVSWAVGATVLITIVGLFVAARRGGTGE